MLDSIPRAADGVGTGCESLSTFAVGDAKHAKSPQTVIEIAMILHHLHVVVSVKLTETTTLYLHYFNSQQANSTALQISEAFLLSM